VPYLQAYGYNFEALALAIMILNSYDELMLWENRLSGVLNNKRQTDSLILINTKTTTYGNQAHYPARWVLSTEPLFVSRARDSIRPTLCGRPHLSVAASQNKIRLCLTAD
jgi:hypothetical protein